MEDLDFLVKPGGVSFVDIGDAKEEIVFFVDALVGSKQSRGCDGTYAKNGKDVDGGFGFFGEAGIGASIIYVCILWFIRGKKEEYDTIYRGEDTIKVSTN